jgi:hypothetical protein
MRKIFLLSFVFLALLVHESVHAQKDSTQPKKGTISPSVIGDGTNGPPQTCTPMNWYQDADGDGFGNLSVIQSACDKPAGYVSNSTDCNDGNSAIKPVQQKCVMG